MLKSHRVNKLLGNFLQTGRSPL